MIEIKAAALEPQHALASTSQKSQCSGVGASVSKPDIPKDVPVAHRHTTRVTPEFKAKKLAPYFCP
jgi:hypothetical protein